MVQSLFWACQHAAAKIAFTIVADCGPYGGPINASYYGRQRSGERRIRELPNKAKIEEQSIDVCGSEAPDLRQRIFGPRDWTKG
jgi:hypothetical protein